MAQALTFACLASERSQVQCPVPTKNPEMYKDPKTHKTTQVRSVANSTCLFLPRAVLCLPYLCRPWEESGQYCKKYPIFKLFAFLGQTNKKARYILSSEAVKQRYAGKEKLSGDPMMNRHQLYTEPKAVQTENPRCTKV